MAQAVAAKRGDAAALQPVVAGRNLDRFEKVDGVWIPFSQETGPRGEPRAQKLVIEKAEPNLPMDDALFAFPQAAK